MKRILQVIPIVASVLMPVISHGQSRTIVESIAAIVGNEVVYLSDIENIIMEHRSNNDKTPTDKLRCTILEQLLTQKLFLDQAKLDSITVSDDQVEAELKARLNDIIRSSGGAENLTGFFNKSMIEIERDIKKMLIETQTIGQVQNTIFEKIKLTPSEVKRYYLSLPKDSLPVIPQKVELSIIQLDPPGNEENKAEARARLLEMRSQVLAGKSFSVLAIMYSEDPGSASNGGELGFLMRGELEKAYADAAFSLTKNSVSKIAETRFGFHIIQLIERDGEMVNTRHILVKPKVKPYQVSRAMSMLDSLADLIRKDTIKFSTAAARFSTHKESRINGGRLVSQNPSERVTWFELSDLNPEMYVKVREMKLGEISDPFRTTDENNNTVFRIIKLDNEMPAHRANLKDDYQAIYNMAMMNKRSKAFDEWIKKKLEVTYIKISDEFKSCDFLQKGWLK